MKDKQWLVFLLAIIPLILPVASLTYGDEPSEGKTREARLRQYASDMALAQICWQIGRLDRALALLERHQPAGGQEDLRGTEWYCLWRTTHAEHRVWVGHSNPVKALAFLPDDSGLVASDMSHTYASAGEIRQWPLSESAPGHMIWQQEGSKQPPLGYLSGFRSLGLSPDGAMLAVPDGQNVRVVDRARGEVKWTLAQHDDYAMTVAFSPNGETLASGGLDQVVKLWNPETGQLAATLTGHTLGVIALAFSPDGKSLAAGGGDDRAPDWSRRRNGELKLWNLETQTSQTLDVSSFVASLTYSPDGRYLAVGLFDGSVAIVDARDRVTKRTLTTSASPVACVRFAPDSQLLATASADGVVRLWEVGTGAERAAYRGHRGSADCLAFSHDGRWLASGGADRTIRIWDAQVSPERTRVPLPAWSIHSVALAADNQTLAASDFHKVWLLNAQTTAEHQHWNTDHWTLSMAISPDASTVVTAGDRESRGGGGAIVRLWDAKQGTQVAELPTSLDSATHVRFSHDGRRVVGQCCDRQRTTFTTMVWDVAAGELVASWPNAQRQAFDLSSRLLAVAAADEIALFDLDQNRTVATLKDPGGTVSAIQLSLDGMHIASAAEDRTVKVWSIANQQPRSTLVGHASDVRQLLFTPDGRYLLTADERETRVWDSTTALLRYKLPHGSCPMTWTPDGQTLITAPGEVHFWQVATGDELLTYPHYGYESRCLAISPDGQFVAQAGGDRDETNGVWLWHAPRPAKTTAAN